MSRASPVRQAYEPDRSGLQWLPETLRSLEPDDRWLAVAPSVAAHMSVPADSVNTPNPKFFIFMSAAGFKAGVNPASL